MWYILRQNTFRRIILAKIRLDDTDDPIDICLDNVFKAVFTRDTPQSQGALSRLLSALIGQELTVTGIVANEPPIDNIRDRQIRFDINCRLKEGRLVNVEMSLNPDHHPGVVQTGQGDNKAHRGDDSPEHWGVFFRYLTDKSKRRTINEILEQEEGIAMASEVLMSISKDEAERARLMSEFKYQMDTQSKIGYARREGRKEIIELLKSGKSPEEILRDYGE
jgi:hypothetical protein